jgi:integrase/recombinase XerC
MFQNQDEDIFIMFEERLTHLALSPSTIINYLADLRTFLRWGQGKIDSEFSVLSVNQEHIRLYRYHLAQELQRATSTVNRHMMALRKFFTFTLDAGLISNDPMTGVALIQENGRVALQALERDEVEKLLRAAQTGSRASLVRRDVAILQLLLHTGLRVSEIVNLQTEDLIFDHPGVRLRVSHKQDEAKTRYLPLSQTVYKVLCDYLAIRPQTTTTNHLFLNQRGQAISDRTVQRIIGDCAKTAGLDGVSAQNLRRTFALHLFTQTNDLALVSQQLGHQTTSITAQYLMAHELSSVDSRH